MAHTRQPVSMSVLLSGKASCENASESSYRDIFDCSVGEKLFCPMMFARYQLYKELLWLYEYLLAVQYG